MKFRHKDHLADFSKVVLLVGGLNNGFGPMTEILLSAGILTIVTINQLSFMFHNGVDLGSTKSRKFLLSLMFTFTWLNNNLAFKVNPLDLFIYGKIQSKITYWK